MIIEHQLASCPFAPESPAALNVYIVMTTGLEEMKDFTFCNKLSVEVTFFHSPLKIFQFMHHQYLHYGSDGSQLLFAALA